MTILDKKLGQLQSISESLSSLVNGEVKFMFDLSMVMLVGTFLGFLFYFILR